MSTNGMVLAQATTVKLTRTLAIIPITLTLALIRTKNAKKEGTEGAKRFLLKRFFLGLFFIL